tara:strand:- start:358 stop:531 length:174 start_codon:yes stop_codon:yes gene_type:complete
MAQANETADNVQITLADLEIVMAEHPEIIKPLRIAALARLKAKSLIEDQKKEAKNVK